jgi:hypothetical protein
MIFQVCSRASILHPDSSKFNPQERRNTAYCPSPPRSTAEPSAASPPLAPSDSARSRRKSRINRLLCAPTTLLLAAFYSRSRAVLDGSTRSTSRPSHGPSLHSPASSTPSSSSRKKTLQKSRGALMPSRTSLLPAQITQTLWPAASSNPSWLRVATSQRATTSSGSCVLCAASKFFAPFTPHCTRY